MKKVLFTVVVAVLGFTNINAQKNESIGGFAKEDVYVGGTVDVSSWKYANQKSNRYSISPSIGYFVSENIAIEASLIIGSSEDVYQNDENSFGGALGATYFFSPVNQFSFNLGFGLAYLSNKVDQSGGESTTNTFVMAVSPGINYFVSDSFALTASVGALSYATSKGDWNGAEAANSFNLNLNLSDINMGLIYKF